MKRTRKSKLPANINAQISHFSHEGRGIAEINGKTTFVFGAIPGETVEIRYTKTCSRYDEAVAVQILEKSPTRQTPLCQAFEQCGGCSLQHITTDEQLALKQQAFIELFLRQGITLPELTSPLTAKSFGYRRKARLSVNHVPRKETTMVGFRERGSHLVTDMQACEVLHPAVGHKIHRLRAFLHALEGAPTLRQLEVAITENQTALILRHMAPLSPKDLEQIMIFAEQENFYWYLQPKGIDSIHLIYPPNTSPLLHYTLPIQQLTFYFYPWQFTQINEEINQQMVTQALSWLDIHSEDEILDLFCGIGNFSLCLAQKAKQVVGVEADVGSVQQACENAKKNQLTNVNFYVGNLFEDCQNLPFAKKTYQKVLLDPPRAGAQEILPLLAKIAPEKIVYVSCNPATLARDAAILREYGYTIAKAGIMDMFPHTQHIEAMVLFTR